MKVSVIRKAIGKPGKNKTGLAKALRIPNSAVTELLGGRRKIKADEIPKIVQYLELDHVPLMGYIGAGAAIDPDFEQVPEEGLGTIQLSFAIPDEMIAFEVRGESMLPAYKHGDAIIVWKEQRRPLETFFGQEAAVRTKDGHRYLKTILPGKGKHNVDLQSFNASTIKNVRLEWIGEIYVILPKPQVKRLERIPSPIVTPRRGAARTARQRAP